MKDRQEENVLYYGDCLTLMQDMPAGSVDLIYLDPPFNSNRVYNAIYKDETGQPLPDQIQAFDDTWRLHRERRASIERLPKIMLKHNMPHTLIVFWEGLVDALRKSRPDLLAYLSYMLERLLEMKRLLRSTGSIYLHCDPTASHYLKILMDHLFGHSNFRREIIWNLQTASGYKSQINGYIRGHDTVLYYTMSSEFIFNKEYIPYGEKYLAVFSKEDEDGRKYRDRGGGRKQYLDESKGVALTDVWSDVMSFQQHSRAAERTGYDTQKPLALLERIIRASSNEGDMVLDPFCGCATTMEAAHRLNRRWIGMDIAIHAIRRVAQKRLTERLGLVDGQDFLVRGIPHTLEGARDLWRQDPYHFQKWAVEQVDGFVTTKRSADGGIDGRIYFAVQDASARRKLESLIIEVKGGDHVSIAHLRSLLGVIEAEKAPMGGLIVLEPLGTVKKRNFDNFISESGKVSVNNYDYPRLQLLSVAEILEGKRFILPQRAAARSLPQRVLDWESP